MSQIQSRSEKQSLFPLGNTVSRDEATWFLARLKEAGVLSNAFTPPTEWESLSEMSSGELATTIRQNLTTSGWHQVIGAMRSHQQQNPELPWDLSKTDDFLTAVRAALAQGSNWPQEKPRKTRPQKKPVNGEGWALSPVSLFAKLAAQARHAQAKAQREGALSQAALYTARMEGKQIERDEALAQVDRLRDQLQHQLQVFCQEQKIQLPAPYSNEEAYCLHLLAAYFVSIAEAEKVIAKRASALVDRQIAIEGERAEATIDARLLPSLLDSLGEVNPLREGFLRERIRHKIALTVGAIVGALFGFFWGMVESISEVLIAGVSHYAPVVAPALLVGLVTLVAQTIAGGVPFMLDQLVQYLIRALWNGSLAFGVTLVVYGCWQYFQTRGIKSTH